MLKCTINGQEVEVKEGTTIIEAMQAHDQHIAHYCYHPGLSVAGVCRLCMVEIEGNPRVQIACNTQVTNGMKVNNTSEKVRDAVKWGLDFHLINHPLDCPICDQAGECGLQEQYMEYGKYNPEMAEKKVKKHKVVDLGPRVVLDSERCILCARCVRFTDEVSKTNELGIFNRGDRAEIGTFAGKPLNNNYSVNTVDICPVGALTSKDFRFQQRVWFLKDVETVCNGCSTGCNVKVYFNKEGVFRVKPVLNKEVNGYWMCDDGRDIYKFINKDHRLLDARIKKSGRTEFLVPELAAKKLATDLQASKGHGVALVLTGQFTVEEFDALVKTSKENLGITHIYHWLSEPEKMEAFDGILNRGDKNPNTKGLQQVLKKYGVELAWKGLEDALAKGEIKTLLVAAPENQSGYKDLQAKLGLFSKASTLVWMSSTQTPAVEGLKNDLIEIPLKSFFEKNGTFINFAGREQKIRKGFDVVANSLTLQNVADILAGRPLASTPEPAAVKVPKRILNQFTGIRGAL